MPPSTGGATETWRARTHTLLWLAGENEAVASRVRMTLYGRIPKRETATNDAIKGRSRGRS